MIGPTHICHRTISQLRESHCNKALYSACKLRSEFFRITTVMQRKTFGMIAGKSRAMMALSTSSIANRPSNPCTTSQHRSRKDVSRSICIQQSAGAGSIESGRRIITYIAGKWLYKTSSHPAAFIIGAQRPYLPPAVKPEDQ